MNLNSIWWLSFFGMILSSCISPIVATVEEEVPGLVVAATLTTLPGTQEVRLQRPASFTTQSLYYAVTRAEVWVENELGQKQYFPESNKTPGLYLPADPNYVAEVGRIYVLHIQTSDKYSYKSTPNLVKACPPIKKIYPEPIMTIYPGLGEVLSGFEILLDTDDPPGKGDYYRWTWVHFENIGFCLTFDGVPFGGGLPGLVGIACCDNPCWDIYRCYQNCTNLLGDALINGRTISGQPITTIPYCPRDYYLEVQQRSISKEAYYYWQAVEQLSSNNGSIFDAAPAAVHGNISCTSDPSQRVYGLFEVADIYETGIFIDRVAAQGNLPTLFTCTPTPLSANPFDCRPCIESAFRTKVKPKYWTK